MYRCDKVSITELNQRNNPFWMVVGEEKTVKMYEFLVDDT